MQKKKKKLQENILPPLSKGHKDQPYYTNIPSHAEGKSILK